MHMVYNGMMNGWDGYGYGGFDFFGWIFMMIVLGIFIVAIVILAMRLNKKSGPMQHETPLDILKKRYANGEIDKKEYDEKKKDLG